MGPIAIPSRLEEAMGLDQAIATWGDVLVDRLDTAIDRWALEVGDPFEPGGRTAWVAPARTTDGREVVLKVGFAHPEGAHEAAGLQTWAGDGAIEVIDAIELGSGVLRGALRDGRPAGEAAHDTLALLLERCDPGTTLAVAADEEHQDEVIAGLLRRLWSVEPAPGRFPTLQSMCDLWADGFEQANERRPVGIDPGLARAGIALLHELPATADRQALLCTDLHAENVLAAQREPWLVVDPKPHVGDPTYDVLQHLLNCPARLHTDPDRLCRRIADLARLDADRVRTWLFARCVQESPHWPGLAELVPRLAP